MKICGAFFYMKELFLHALIFMLTPLTFWNTNSADENPVIQNPGGSLRWFYIIYANDGFNFRVWIVGHYELYELYKHYRLYELMNTTFKLKKGNLPEIIPQ
jgi:hypothetical protein